MAITQAVTCDVCATQRKEANHWFTCVTQNDQVAFYPWSDANMQTHEHLCSERCCMTVLSRMLAGWGRKLAA